MEQTVVRTGDPLEVIAWVEHVLGFRPTESLVVVSLRPPRQRIGLVARVDLADAAAPAVAASLAAHLTADGADRAVVLVHSAAAPPVEALRERHLGLLPHADTASAARQALADRGLGCEAWLVRPGRLHSYTCPRPCCPPGGRVLASTSGT